METEPTTPPRLIEPSNSQPTRDDNGSGSAVRDRVHRAIAQHLKTVTEGDIRHVSSAFGREVLDVVIEIVIRTALQEGYFRLPSGFGSFKVTQLRSSTKRLPTGALVSLTEPRSRLRYEEGAAVRELLGMPYKTSYRRKYHRQSKVSPKALDIAFPDEAAS
jgi:hypothetical protein